MYVLFRFILFKFSFSFFYLFPMFNFSATTYTVQFCFCIFFVFILFGFNEQKCFIVLVFIVLVCSCFRVWVHVKYLNGFCRVTKLFAPKLLELNVQPCVLATKCLWSVLSFLKLDWALFITLSPVKFLWVLDHDSLFENILDWSLIEIFVVPVAVLLQRLNIYSLCVLCSR